MQEMIYDIGVELIKVRIIELTNKKINLENEIFEVDRHAKYADVNQVDKDRMLQNLRRLKTRLYEVEKVLYLNKYLLNQTDEHDYQLEN
jgi:hypothetical protein